MAGYDYSQPGWYFVTIRVKKGHSLFGDVIDGRMELSEIGKFARQCWLDIPNHYPNVVLDEFIVMPNHVHGIVGFDRARIQNRGDKIMHAKSF